MKYLTMDDGRERLDDLAQTEEAMNGTVVRRNLDLTSTVDNGWNDHEPRCEVCGNHLYEHWRGRPCSIAKSAEKREVGA